MQLLQITEGNGNSNAGKKGNVMYNWEWERTRTVTVILLFKDGWHEHSNSLSTYLTCNDDPPSDWSI